MVYIPDSGSSFQALGDQIAHWEVGLGSGIWDSCNTSVILKHTEDFGHLVYNLRSKFIHENKICQFSFNKTHI